MPAEDRGDGVEPGQRDEAVGLQRVEADGDAAQPRVLQRLDWAASRMPLVVSARSRTPALAGQAADERRQVAAQQRLAAGEAEAVDAEADEDADEPLHLLECQEIPPRQPEILRLGHAVAATKIAAIGHRQPEAPQRPVEGVPQRHLLDYAPAGTGCAPSPALERRKRV